MEELAEKDVGAAAGIERVDAGGPRGLHGPLVPLGLLGRAVSGWRLGLVYARRHRAYVGTRPARIGQPRALTAGRTMT